MTLFNDSNVHVGDKINAEDDEDLWGDVRQTFGKFVVAYYPDLKQEYEVDYDTILQVTCTDTNVTATGVDDADMVVESLPAKAASKPAKAAAPVPASTLTVAELVNQKRIWPGNIVTWAKGFRQGYDPDRMFVILNFTKNSNRTAVNIAPLNGPQLGERRNADYYRVDIKDVSPVTFNQPMVKKVVSK